MHPLSQAVKEFKEVKAQHQAMASLLELDLSAFNFPQVQPGATQLFASERHSGLSHPS
jgi:hypothetical protein